MKKKLSNLKEVLKKVLYKVKKNKKRILLGIGVFLIVFIPTFLYINLTSPTRINKYIAHIINKGNPANSAFDDENFYYAVVDAYNKKTGINVPYTTNLTDDQLKVITEISYYGGNKTDDKKIKSTKGLEKLINLVHLSLYENKSLSTIDVSKNTKLTELSLTQINLSTIDVSKNTKLVLLNLYYNNLTSIDVSHNTSLKELNLHNNNLSTIDVSKNTLLTWLNLSSNNISAIDVSKNTKLVLLNLYYNNLTSIDVSHNTSLKELDLHNNNLSTIDVSKNTTLTRLDLSSNNLSTIYVSNNIALTSLSLNDNNNLRAIDLSKNTALTYLSLNDNNNISEIDVSKNTKLTSLSLNGNNLSEIDVSDNIVLKELNLESNNLSAIDLSKNTKLTSLNLYYNNLTSIDLSRNIELETLELQYNSLSAIDFSNNKKLTSLNLSNNYLKNIKLHDGFNVLDLSKVIKNQGSNQEKIELGDNRVINPINGYKYYINEKIVIPSSCSISEFIQNLRLNNITAKVYNGEEEIVNGNIEDNYTFKMFYEDNLFEQGVIHIFNNPIFDDENFYKAVIDAYNKENGTSLLPTTNLTYDQLQTVETISYDGYGKNKSEKIRSTKGVEKLTSLTTLYLQYNNLSAIDLSHNTLLTSLYLNNNNLSTIDVSNNTALTSLDLSYNNLSVIDVSNNTALTRLDLENNNISVIDVSNNTSLTRLDLDYNNLSEIDVSHNTSLTRLYLENTNLSTIDVSNNTALTSLDLSYNNLSVIDVSNNTKLGYLNLENTNLSTIDVSNNTALTYLDLQHNNLSAIDLSDNIVLKELNLESNNLSAIDLSHNTNLTTLNLSHNRLGEIDVSKNTGLTHLDLENNNLSAIDLSKNTKLTSLFLDYNPLRLKAYVKKGRTTYGNILMPKNSTKFYNTFEIEDESIATSNNDIINGIKVGQTNAELTITIAGYYKKLKSNGTITVYDITSNKYEIDDDNKYVYTKADTDSNTILSNINLENIEGRIEDNKLVLYDEETVVDSYDIVNISSDKYDLTKNYIYTGINEFNINDIICTNCTLEVNEHNVLNVKYNNKVIDLKDIVTISSNKYELSKEYIYVDNNSFNKNDITTTNSQLTVENNVLKIKYGDEVLDTKKIASISSEVYDLSKEYIYDLNNSFDINNINSINCDVEYSDGKVIVKYEDDILRQIDVVSINIESSLYDLSKDYIYVGEKEFDSSKIESTNVTYEEKDNKLYLKYNDDVLKTYKLIKVSSSDYEIKDGFIYVFTNIFDKNNINVTNADITVSNNIVTIKYEEDTVGTYKIVGITSTKYDLTKEYIYVKTEEFDSSLINTSNVTIEETDNKLKVLYEDEVIKTYDIVSIRSEYDLTNEYFYNKDIDINNINVINGTLEETNDAINIKYNDEVIDSIKLIRLVSEEYTIKDDYIYIGNNAFNNEKVNVINGTFEVTSDNKLKVKYNNEVIDIYDIVSYSSNKYDLSKEYIYLGLNKLNTNDIICTNCSLEEKNNKLNIKYKEEVIKSYDLINIESREYDLTKEYIYTKDNTLDINSVEVINGTKEISNNKLNIKYKEEVIKSYNIIRVTSNIYNLSKEYIYTKNNEFNINNVEVINGSKEISNNILNIKYNNEIIDTYKIVKISSTKYNLSKEYIYVGTNTFNTNDVTCINCTVDVSNNILSIKYGSEELDRYKISSVRSTKYDLTKNSILINKSTFNINDIEVINCDKEYDSVNNKLYIKYDNDILKEYTLYTRKKGDVTGDDKITSLDYINIRKYIMKKLTLNEEEMQGADVNGDGKVTSLDYILVKRYIMKGSFE